MQSGLKVCVCVTSESKKTKGHRTRQSKCFYFENFSNPTDLIFSNLISKSKSRQADSSRDKRGGGQIKIKLNANTRCGFLSDETN